MLFWDVEQPSIVVFRLEQLAGQQLVLDVCLGDPVGRALLKSDRGHLHWQTLKVEMLVQFFVGYAPPFYDLSG